MKFKLLITHFKQVTGYTRSHIIYISIVPIDNQYQPHVRNINYHYIFPYRLSTSTANFQCCA